MRGRWTIPDSRVLGHSDVAPARKQDPGELFPWRRLAEAGHGLWFDPEPAPGGPLGEGAEGTAVFALQAGLHRLGYEPLPSGRYDAETAQTVAAFQRHWRPERVDGAACGDTRARLMAILRLASVETVTGVLVSPVAHNPATFVHRRGPPEPAASAVSGISSIYKIMTGPWYGGGSPVRAHRASESGGAVRRDRVRQLLSK